MGKDQPPDLASLVPSEAVALPESAEKSASSPAPVREQVPQGNSAKIPGTCNFSCYKKIKTRKEKLSIADIFSYTFLFFYLDDQREGVEFWIETWSIYP